MTAKFIAILANPRTGTNYLCDLIDRFDEVDSLYEIYSKDAVYIGKNKHLRRDIIDYINREYNLKINGCSDPSFVDFASRNPQTLLEIIAKKSKCQYVSFKVFNYHLSREKWKKLILQNKQIIKIIVKRNLLDAYVSERIAFDINRWTMSDTSKVRIEFDENHFVKWLSIQNKYYNFLETELAKSNQIINKLKYETLHSYQNNKEKFQYLFNFFRSLGLDIDLNNLSNKNLSEKLREKQDKRRSILEKVSNPEVLLDTLKNNDLEFLLTSNHEKNRLTY